VGEEYRNRLYFVTPTGEVEHYDKWHLFSVGGEVEHYSRGNVRKVVEWRGVRYLLAICYDLRFPVWSRQRGDYDAIIYSALWPSPRRAVWQTLLRARAIENQAYVVGVNRIGNEPTLSYSGDSAVIDYRGVAVAECESREFIAYAELDVDALNRFRVKFNVSADADDFELR
jgi:predicted amidohydrolase